MGLTYTLVSTCVCLLIKKKRKRKHALTLRLHGNQSRRIHTHSFKYFFSLFALIVRLHLQKMLYFLHASINSSWHSYYSLKSDWRFKKKSDRSFLLSKVLWHRSEIRIKIKFEIMDFSIQFNSWVQLYFSLPLCLGQEFFSYQWSQKLPHLNYNAREMLEIVTFEFS